jgi:hypothetical protein
VKIAPQLPTKSNKAFDFNTNYRLITQRSRVQIPPPQPNPNKIDHPRPPQISLSGRIAPQLPQGFSTPCTAYLTLASGLPLCGVADKRLPSHRKFLLSFSVSAVTVLVRRLLDSNVIPCRPFSLRKLCVAHSRAKGAFNENSSGFILRLCSVQPLRVYAGCHAQPCVRSRASRPGWRSNSVSPRLQLPQGAGPVAGQASQEVVLSQGASSWGRLAY